MAGTNNNKSVIVTGGASGIGLAIVRHFASQGHQVSIFDLDVESGAAVAAEVAAENPLATVTFKRCDVSSWEDLSAAFEEVHRAAGRVDIVMANAGIADRGPSPLWKVDEDELMRPSTEGLNVNLLGPIYCVRLATHYMRKNRPDPTTKSRGLIVCTGSMLGLYSSPANPLYGISKYGVIGLVRSMAKPLEQIGIQINSLAPSIIATNIAPKELYDAVILTPLSTVIRAVSRFVDNPQLTGEVAEIHGNNVTLRPHHEIVDKDTEHNLKMFWEFRPTVPGYSTP